VATATWNPSDKGASVTLTSGNLTAQCALTAASPDSVRATLSKTTGKWYWEITISSASGGTAGNNVIGVANASFDVTASSAAPGSDLHAIGWRNNTGQIVRNGVVLSAGDFYVAGDVLSVAMDLDTGSIVFRKNNTIVATIGSVNFPTGALFPLVGTLSGTSQSYVTNFGATAFTYTPPAGHSGLTDTIDFTHTMTGGVSVAGEATVEFYPPPTHTMTGGMKVGGAATIIYFSNGILSGELPGPLSTSFTSTVDPSGPFAFTLPGVQAVLAGTITNFPGTLTATLLLPSTSFTGGTQNIRATLPRPWTTSFTATLSPPATLAVRLTKYSTSFTARASYPGVLDINLFPITASFTSRASKIGGLDAELPKIYATFTSAAGRSGPFTITLPELEASFGGRTSISGTVSATLPMLYFTASSYQLFSTLAETVVVNTRTFAHSTYSYGFLGYANFAGVSLGIKADGIYRLDTGDSDIGASTVAIDYEVAWGLLDYGMPVLKHLDAFYATCRTDGQMQVLVTADEGTEYTYTVGHNADPVLKQRRVLIGKGLRGTNYKIKIKGVSGSDAEIDNVHLIVKPTKRSV
jgi:hypothetical protein